MAATSIPQLLAYAETVGYAGHRGLSTAGLPLFAWGCTTGHPYMNSGVTSITAMMARADLRGEDYLTHDNHTEEDYVYLVAMYSLLVGVASIVLATIGFGQMVATVVPKPVRAGFKWGCALGVFLSALPNGLFDKGGSQLKHLLLAQQEQSDQQGNLWVHCLKLLKTNFPGGVNILQCAFALTHPWLWSVAPSVIFIAGTIFVMQGPNILPKALPPGTEVVLLTAAATLYSQYMTTYPYTGVVVGEIPTMDPDAGISLWGIKLPVEFLNFQRVSQVSPLVERFGGSYLKLILSATIYAAVNFLSIIGIASGFESEQGISWNARRELYAQGVSCLVAAAVGSAPVSGSLSRSLVSRMTGTTSQLACMVTALCWIYLQPYMSIMTPCPKAALSAVIVSAVIKGIAIPKELLQLQGVESIVVGWCTAFVTAATSPTTGFGAGLLFYYSTAFATTFTRAKTTSMVDIPTSHTKTKSE
jgi:MFS superfamily sulfate permease-like transporter